MFTILHALKLFLDTLTDGAPLWRLWALAIIVSVFFLIYYSTRRQAAVALVALLLGAYTWNFIHATYQTYQPRPQATSKKWLR